MELFGFGSSLIFEFVSILRNFVLHFIHFSPSCLINFFALISKTSILMIEDFPRIVAAFAILMPSVESNAFLINTCFIISLKLDCSPILSRLISAIFPLVYQSVSHLVDRFPLKQVPRGDLHKKLLSTV